MHDLSRILAVRQRRCDTLRRVERVAKDRILAARNRVASVRKSMDDYAEQIRTLEIDLLTDLMKTELNKTDFDRFREKLEAAELRARRLADRFKEASRALSDAERDIDKARRNRREMEAKVNRVGQVLDVLDEGLRLEQTQALDAEMDEIAGILAARHGGG